MKMKGLMLDAATAAILILSLSGDQRFGISSSPSVSDGPNKAVLSIAPDYGKIPLYFIPNCGQVEEQALYYAKTSGYTLWITKEGLVFDSAIPEAETENSAKKLKDPAPAVTLERKAVPYHRDTARMIFLNSNRNTEVVASELTEHRVNYFIGNDPTKWKNDIPTSLAVLYKEIYPGVDLKVYGRERQIEYDWVVKPGAQVEDIRFEYRDAEKTEVDRAGNLVIKTIFGELVHRKPLSYQWIEGKKIAIASQFKIFADNRFGFEVQGYQESHELLIDPLILVYSTYLGGSEFDIGSGIAVDKKGAAYIVGTTYSTDFPLENSYQNNFKGRSDVFVTKFSPSGKSLSYSTYLGGKDNDGGAKIAVDKSGAAYLTGGTFSTDFPLKNPFQKTYKGQLEIFVTKLAPAGNALVYSTYLGGIKIDSSSDIAVDASGAAIIVGTTSSTDFPLQSPIQAVYKGREDVFVTKFSAQGNSLVYSTYLGGVDCDYGNAVAVDSSGAVYLTGETTSYDFPLQNPYQNNNKGRLDIFVAKLVPAGDALAYSTYLGGVQYDYGKGIAVDSTGAVYVAGKTYSADFPLKNPFQKTFKAFYGHGYVTKFTAEGNALAYSTFLGGKQEDEVRGIVLDRRGAAYIAGFTNSPNFPLKNPWQSTKKTGQDAFVVKLLPAGTSLGYATFLGGNDHESARDIAVDDSGASYVTGDTLSTNFPLQNPYQKTGGVPDAFVAKLLEGGLTVLSPNGGETWKVNGAYDIEWKYSGSIGTRVKVELMKGTKLIRTISSSASIGADGKGSCKWQVPSNLTPGTNFKIKITSKQVTACTDSSDKYFSIAK
jgi:hypothetical protein